jgi:hypothetical protein
VPFDGYKNENKIFEPECFSMGIKMKIKYFSQGAFQWV